MSPLHILVSPYFPFITFLLYSFANSKNKLLFFENSFRILLANVSFELMMLFAKLIPSFKSNFITSFICSHSFKNVFESCGTSSPCTIRPKILVSFIKHRQHITCKFIKSFITHIRIFTRLCPYLYMCLTKIISDKFIFHFITHIETAIQPTSLYL